MRARPHRRRIRTLMIRRSVRVGVRRGLVCGRLAGPPCSPRRTASNGPPNAGLSLVRPGSARPPAAEASRPRRHNGPDADVQSRSGGITVRHEGLSGRRCRCRNPHQARRPSPISRSLKREPRHQPPWTEHLAGTRQLRGDLCLVGQVGHIEGGQRNLREHRRPPRVSALSGRRSIR